jgi:geranylgeranyl pyrophosphate synthase
MWKNRQTEFLRDEIESLLQPLVNVTSLYDLVREPLTKAGRGLASESAQVYPWPLLPLMVCEAISKRYEKALPVAAVLQFFIAAGEVFDDIEDADYSNSLSARYGSAVATNAATTLLILAEGAIVRLEARGVEDYIIVRVMDLINSFYTTTCIGQHLDLSCTSEITFSEDLYLRVAGMKSASTAECACYIGALLANANDELVDIFGRFGHNLGMAAQIANDIQGITLGNDIIKGKITLPVIYALAQADRETRDRIKRGFNKQFVAKLDPMQIRDLLFHTGAIHYAAIKMESYKQQALDNLSKAEKAGVRVQRLKLFLG